MYVSKEASRVRIPLSPPTCAKATVGRPFATDDQKIGEPSGIRVAGVKVE